MTTETTYSVLLVDDDPAVRGMLELALSQAGCRVQAVPSGQEAIDRFQTSIDHFDVLITDLQMPGMNGQELALHLVRLRPCLPIIFISADPGHHWMPTHELFPNHLYVQKPFLPSELVEQMKLLLSS